MPKDNTPSFTVEVDGEDYVIDVRTLAAAELLRRVGCDPAKHDLVQIKGKKHVTLQDDAEIKIHAGLRFVTIACGPTPVK